jgi:hypothetical protein
MRGGGATEYVYGAVGSGDAQYNRTLDQAGQYGQIQGNVLIGAQGQNVMPPSQVPSASQLQLIQSAGRRRRGSRSRRGGFLGEVVNQAIVPFALLGMQQTYRRKRGGKRHTRRHTRRHRR